MSEENPTKNAHLTPEQAIQLDAFTKRADSLKSLITIHQTNITGLQNTNAMLEKDRENLTQTIEAKKPLLVELESKQTDLNEQIVEAQKLLSDTREQTKELLAQQEASKQEASLREKALAQREMEHQQKSDLLNKMTQSVQSDKASLELKKSKLSEVLTQL